MVPTDPVNDDFDSFRADGRVLWEHDGHVEIMVATAAPVCVRPAYST
jgi:hypothetical protein